MLENASPTATMTGKDFCDILCERGYTFYTGVPCSFFKHAINQVISDPRLTYVIAANEGAALAIAAGAWLGQRKPTLLIQSSGVGNLVNPITSLSLPYRIPSLIFISARAYPDGADDEPQHRIIGRTLKAQMTSFGTYHMEMPMGAEDFRGFVAEADDIISRHEGIVTAMVPKGSIDMSCAASAAGGSAYPMGRLEAIQLVAGLLCGNEAVVSSTGKISRELFMTHDRKANFYMQGSMGHARAIALGIALTRPRQRVVSLDGDGATLMHMGSLSTVGYYAPPNLIDIVLDNEAYESTGNQDTTSSTTDLQLVAKACGYPYAYRCATAEELRNALGEALRRPGPSFLLVKINRQRQAVPPRITSKYEQTTTARNVRSSLEVNATTPSLYFGEGCVRDLPRLLAAHQARRVLLVCGSRSFEVSGAKQAIDGGLAGCHVDRFSDFSPNPKLENVEQGARILRDRVYDAVVGIGGGTAMDIAKAITVLAAQDGEPADYIRNGRSPEHERKHTLILIPTTAGTGSEVTSFSVVYVDGVKHSLDHPSLLADYSIVDPGLTWSMPCRLTAATGIDALSQAIESYWSQRSTPESRYPAAQAIRLVLDHLEDACRNPSPASRAAMSRAATLSGQAINITRTTAPHAASYPLTAAFGIPHGHACGLTLSQFLLFNGETSEEDVLDPRGAQFVQQRIGEILELLGVDTPEAGCERIASLLKNIGLEARLSELGLGADAIEAIAAGGLNPDRVGNNPRRLTEQGLRSILTAIA